MLTRTQSRTKQGKKEINEFHANFPFASEASRIKELSSSGVVNLT